MTRKNYIRIAETLAQTLSEASDSQYSIAMGYEDVENEYRHYITDYSTLYRL